MSGFKVFQCAPMDYHLEPARYEEMTFVKLLARYKLIMNCDWVMKMQDVIDATAVVDGAAPATTDMMDVEEMRSGLCDFYSTSASGADFVIHADHASGELSGEVGGVVTPVNEQWQHLIETILTLTSWAAVSNEVGATYGATTRIVSQNKVDKELLYTANVANGAGVITAILDIDGTVESSLNASGGASAVMGIAGVANGAYTQYNPESIGQLINNTNVREILVQMRNHGCFIIDYNKSASGTDEAGSKGDPTNNKYVVNPVIQASTLAADDTLLKQTLLDKDDELVFPVNLKTIVGHTLGGTEEYIQDAASLEINIVFKQNDQLDASAGHVDNDFLTQQ